MTTKTAASKTAECQICGRNIKTPQGLIAHHGFKRHPFGHGLMGNSSSCPGARHWPFDKSNDAILRLLKEANEHLAKFKANRAELLANPPDELKYLSYNSGRRDFTNVDKERLYPRPEDFDPNVTGLLRYPASYVKNSYAYCFWVRIQHWDRSIESHEYYIKSLTERNNEWMKQHPEPETRTFSLAAVLMCTTDLHLTEVSKAEEVEQFMTSHPSWTNAHRKYLGTDKWLTARSDAIAEAIFEQREELRAVVRHDLQKTLKGADESLVFLAMLRLEDYYGKIVSLTNGPYKEVYNHE